MKVLITGGNGFIGRRATSKLVADGIAVRWASRSVPDALPAGVDHVQMDVSKPEQIGAALEGCSHVIHLAAREDMPLLPKGDPFGDLMFKTNVLGTDALLTACGERGIKKIVVCTAIWSFGWDKDGGANDGSRPRNVSVFGSTYAWSRYQCEFVCLEHAAKGVPVVIACPSIVVGAGDQKVAGPAVRWAQKGMVRFVPSGGANCIDVDDVAQGLVNALERGEPGRRYLFVNENIKWQSFFSLIADELDVSRPWVLPDFFMRAARWFVAFRGWITGRSRAFGVGPELLTSDFYFSASNAVDEIGLPQTPISESVAQTVRWVRTGELPAPRAQLQEPSTAVTDEATPDSAG